MADAIRHMTASKLTTGWLLCVTRVGSGAGEQHAFRDLEEAMKWLSSQAYLADAAIAAVRAHDAAQPASPPVWEGE